MKILVIDFNFLGDCLMSSPAVKALAYSQASDVLYVNQVDVLSFDFTNAVLAGNSYITHTYACLSSLWQRVKACYRLRVNNYDLAIQFNTSLTTNLLMCLTGAQRRMGYSYKWCGIGLTDKVPLPHRTLTKGNRIDEVCSLVERGLGYEIKDRSMVFCVEKRAFAPDRDFIIVHTNTRNTQWLRRWGGWRELGVLLSKRFPGVCLYFTGTAEDRDYVTSEIPYVNSRNMCGETTVQELASLLQQARLCITVNTFAMHLAIAVGAPTVAIVGGTIADVVCPKNNPRFKYIQDPKLNMNAISPQMVMEKVEEFFIHNKNNR